MSNKKQSITQIVENIEKINNEIPNISETGSLRYNKGKSQIHQVPYEAIEGIAKVMEYGEKKYGKYNWTKGNNLSVPFDSAMRHLWAFWNGENFDKESGENHLYHALANIAMIIYYHKNYPEMDDRYNKE